MQTINQLESAVQTALEALRKTTFDEDAAVAKEVLLPDGLTPVVELIHESGRRKRGDAASWNWNPQSDRILISFRPVARPEVPQSAIAAPAAPFTTEPKYSPADSKSPAASASVDAVTAHEIIECCQALASAERSNRQFIALKWFRDDFLATVDYPWAKAGPRRQRVLTQAIDMGRIIAKKIHNPKAPQFPTTTISLNRSVPTPGVPPRFQPVAIRGEAASATLLHDRGSL